MSARFRGRKDKTHAAIVTVLRAAGASVEALDGKGTPDLLVGYGGRDHLIECKSKGGALNADQAKWHADWKGSPVATAFTPEQALRAIGAPLTLEALQSPAYRAHLRELLGVLNPKSKAALNVKRLRPSRRRYT